MKTLKSIFSKGWLCLLFFLIAVPTSEASNFQFSMEAVIPANQVDSSKTFFDLRIEPGQVQDLEIVLINQTDSPLTLEVYATTAVTNRNGVIDYTIPANKDDEEKKLSFAEMAHVLTPEVTLAVNEEKKVAIQVTVPDEPFNGIVLGGIYVLPKDESKEEGAGKVLTRQAMVKAVRLSENDEPVAPEIIMKKAQAGQVGYRNVFEATLENIKPVIIDYLTVEAAVYKKGNLHTPLYTSKTENLRMAPESQFDYSVPLNDELFVAGEYVMKLTATAAGQQWDFEQPLTVTVVQAEELNKNIPEELLEKPEKKGVHGWVWMGILVAAAGLLAFTWWQPATRKWWLESISQVHGKIKKGGTKLGSAFLDDPPMDKKRKPVKSKKKKWLKK